jgi:hypothetical protein
MRIVIIVFAALIVTFAALIIILLSTKTYESYKSLVDIAQVVTALLTVAALVFVGFQIDTQREDFSLDKRPYLYLYLEPVFNFAESQLFGGGGLVFDNRGKIPASDVVLDFQISSDKNREPKLKEWYVENFGDFPQVTTVFPDHKGTFVFIHPQIGNDAKLCYLAAKVSYSSTKTKKKYWYTFRTLYALNRDHQGNLTKDKNGNLSATLIYTYTDWDRNSDKEAPALVDCDWDKHLSAKAMK